MANTCFQGDRTANTNRLAKGQQPIRIGYFANTVAKTDNKI